MGGIKYYQLSKDEELPDEFCAVKDIGGEPSEYTFYVPEAENDRLRGQYETVIADYRSEVAKLRELVRDMWHEGMCECGSLGKCATCMYEYPTRMHELGVEQWASS